MKNPVAVVDPRFTVSRSILKNHGANLCMGGGWQKKHQILFDVIICTATPCRTPEFWCNGKSPFWSSDISHPNFRIFLVAKFPSYPCFFRVTCSPKVYIGFTGTPNQSCLDLFGPALHCYHLGEAEKDGERATFGVDGSQNGWLSPPKSSSFWGFTTSFSCSVGIFEWFEPLYCAETARCLAQA